MQPCNQIWNKPTWANEYKFLHRFVGGIKHCNLYKDCIHGSTLFDYKIGQLPSSVEKNCRWWNNKKRTTVSNFELIFAPGDCRVQPELELHFHLRAACSRFFPRAWIFHASSSTQYLHAIAFSVKETRALIFLPPNCLHIGYLIRNLKILIRAVKPD